MRSRLQRSTFRAASIACRGVLHTPSRIPNSRMHCTTERNSHTCRNNEEVLDEIFVLPPQYLRASDPSNFDSNLQRSDISYDIHDGRPIVMSTDGEQKHKIASCTLENGYYQIKWEDGVTSVYDQSWIQKQISSWKESSSEHIPWTRFTEDMVRESSTLNISFEYVITDAGMKQALKSLVQYGILLVSNTPIHDNGAGIAVLGAALGGGSKKNETSILSQYRQGGSEIVLPHGTDGPLRTLYGTVWSTTSSGQAVGASVADSAYGQDGLPLHTDMTYYRDPPGLQIFTMVQPAIEGGESIFGDGFAAAEQLHLEDPNAFDVLTQTIRRYRSVDPVTGWHLEARGPVISVLNNRVIGIRHNDLDRLPDLPEQSLGSTPKDVDEFYADLHSAHQAWDRILAQDDFRLVMKLQPGDTMVVVNQRCLHGRFRFAASPEFPRAVMGCYISQDELYSRFRMEGFDAY